MKWYLSIYANIAIANNYRNWHKHIIENHQHFENAIKIKIYEVNTLSHFFYFKKSLFNFRQLYEEQGFSHVINVILFISCYDSHLIAINIAKYTVFGNEYCPPLKITSTVDFILGKKQQHWTFFWSVFDSFEMSNKCDFDDNLF